MATAAAELFVKVSADIKQFTAGLDSAAKATESAGASIKKLSSASDVLKKLESQLEAERYVAQKLGTTWDESAAQVNHFERAIQALIKSGVDPANAELNKSIAYLKEYKRVQDSASTSNSTFGSTFKATLAAFIGGNIIVDTLRGIGNAMSNVVSSSLSMAGAMQQNKMAFTQMLGSAEKANTMLQKLQEFSLASGMEFSGLVDSTKRMMAFGISAQAVIPVMTAVGNAVAALGGGKEKIDGVTLALGQMATKGTVHAQEMNQLAERGIPAWSILAKSIGVGIPQAMKMAENGAISSGQAITALVNGLNERFPNMLLKNTQQYNGALAALQNSTGMALGQIGEALIKNLNLVPIIHAITNAINNLTAAFIGGGLIAAFDRAFGPASKALIIGVGAAITGAMIPSIVAATAALGRMAIAAVAAAVPYWPLIAAGAALSVIAYAVIKNWDKVKDALAAVADVGNKAFTWLHNKVTAAFESMTSWGATAMAWLRDKIVAIIGPDLAAKIGMGFDAVGGKIASMGKWTADSFTYVKTSISSMASTVGSDFTTVFEDLKKSSILAGGKVTEDMLGIAKAAAVTKEHVAKNSAAHKEAAAAAREHAQELKLAAHEAAQFFERIASKIEVLGTLSSELKKANDKSVALGDVFDLAGAKAEIFRQILPDLEKAFGRHSQAVAIATESMNRFKNASENGGAVAAEAAKRIAQTDKDFKKVELSAMALGEAFDAVSVNLDIQKEAMRDLIKLGIEPGNKAWDTQIQKLQQAQVLYYQAPAGIQAMANAFLQGIAAVEQLYKALGTLGEIFGIQLPDWAKNAAKAMYDAAVAVGAVILAVAGLVLAFEAFDKISKFNGLLASITLVAAGLVGLISLLKSVTDYFKTEAQKQADAIAKYQEEAAQRALASWNQSIQGIQGAFKAGFSAMLSGSDDWAEQLRIKIRDAVIAAFMDKMITEGLMSSLAAQMENIKYLMAWPTSQAFKSAVDTFAIDLKAKVAQITPAMQSFANVINNALPGAAKPNTAAVEAYTKQLASINSRLSQLASAGADSPTSSLNKEWLQLTSAAATAQNNIRLAQMGRLALGGLVTGPTVARLGEGGRNEAVLPLNDNVFRQIADGISGNGGAAATVNINYYGSGKWTREDASQLGRLMVAELRSLGVRA